MELPLLLGLGAVALGLTGAGTLSLDEATCRVLDRPWLAAGSFVGSAAVASVVIGRRNRTVAKRAGAAEEEQREAESTENKGNE
jgi:putative oxidoreductase